MTAPGRRSSSGRPKRSGREKQVLGWREWAGLPDFGVAAIKAKLDTGARSASLHAFDLEEFSEEGRRMVRFELHPVQRSSAVAVPATAEIVDERLVRNTSGSQELRPVIRCTLELGHQRWPAEVSLTRRDEMGFRMLLGRQTLRKRFLVDPARSFLGRPPPDDPSRPRSGEEE